MEIETSMAKHIRTTDEKAQYDAACKRLLSEKIVLAWIMKSCLPEYQECDVREIAQRYIEGEPQVGSATVEPDEGAGTAIHGVSSEDTSLTEGTVTYDVRFHALAPGSGELIRLIVNVEAQGVFDPGYPLVKRGLYYCSRMISAQKGTEFTGSHYERIRKVYSIWVCLSPPADRRNSITRYRIVEENQVGDVREPAENYDLLSVIMLCLGGAEDERYGGILKLLDVLLSAKAGAAERRRVLEEEFDVAMTQEIEREVSLMCNLSELVEREGIAKGLAKGRAESRAESRAEGIAEGVLTSIRSLMNSMGWTAQQAMEALKVSAEEQQQYIDRLAI